MCCMPFFTCTNIEFFSSPKGHLVLDELYMVWNLVIILSETLFSRFPFVRNLPRALGTSFRKKETNELDVLIPTGLSFIDS